MPPSAYCDMPNALGSSTHSMASTQHGDDTTHGAPVKKSSGAKEASRSAFGARAFGLKRHRAAAMSHATRSTGKKTAPDQYPDEASKRNILVVSNFCISIPND